MAELSRDTIGELFMNLLQHLKCMEVRLDYAKAASTQKQKYAIGKAFTKAQGAINDICDLLGNSDMVAKVKKELDKTDLVYIMTLTEQLFRMKEEDLEKVTDMIDEYLKEKYEPEISQS